MADVETLQKCVTERFPHFIQYSHIANDELTIQVAKVHLQEVCLALRDDPEFDFKMLIDVCGVDYLHYGVSEWQTESSTATGFERGVEMTALLNPPESPAYEEGNEDTFSDADFRSEGETVPPRFTDKKASNSPYRETVPPGGLSGEHRFASVYHLLSLELNHRIRLRVLLDSHRPQVPSVVDLWPAANWFEREAFDLFGIIFVGHPDLRRLLTDYGFIGHPFRKDFPLIGNVEARYDAQLSRVVYEPVSIQPRILEPKVIRNDNRYKVGE